MTDLCPDCLRANIVATRDGPTCTHQRNVGANWWPSWWANAHEHERVKWLQERRDLRKATR